MNQLEITQEYVTYQSQTALVNLAQQVATSRSKTKPAIKQAIQLGTQIRLGLEALNYSAFLTKPQIDEILYLLSQIATINGFPFAPTVTSVALPNILLGVVGPIGPIGPQGVTGGGYPFLVSNITTDQVIDEFPITLCGAAEWLYDVHDNQNKRVERLVGCWLPDGSQFRDDGGVTIDPEIGNTTGKISFYINYAGGNIQLIAHVTSGTWTVAGSRIQIPVNGNGVILPSSLTNGSIWIGSPANTPAEWAVSGDISLSNAGVANINPGVIVNADINAAAAIALTKLAALTPSLAVVTDINGFLTTGLTTATQIGYLSTTTSDVQVQINSKLTVNLGPAVTGDILYYNGANWTNFPRGTNGQLLSSNAGTIAWVSGGSGITNTALNNEVMKSNGVNAVSSGMFSSSIADLILGSAAIVGSARNLSVQGSAPNINLFIQSKGTGNIGFYDEVFTQYLSASKTNFLALYTLQSELQLKSALTSTVGNSLKVSIKTSGSPVAGIGVGIEFQTQTGVATDKIGSFIQSISTNVGVGTEAFDLAFFNMVGGAAATEKFRFKAAGDFAVAGSVGTAGQFLTSGGAGASPTWTTSVGVPGGANTNIQFNNAGVFGGSSNLIWDGTFFRVKNPPVPAVEMNTNGVSLNFNSTHVSGVAFDIQVGSTTFGNSIALRGGNVSSGNSAGGAVSLVGGNAFATSSGNGGNVILTSGVPGNTGVEGSINIQTRTTGKIGFFNVASVPKQGAATSPQGIADALTAYGLLPASVIGVGVAGGANTNVQFNNSGILDGSNNFVWSNANSRLSVIGILGLGIAADPTYVLRMVGSSVLQSNPSAAVTYAMISTNGNWVFGSDDAGNGSSGNQFFIKNQTDLQYRLTIQRGTGNVGIGTTTPTNLLDVVSNTSGQSTIRVLNDGTGQANIIFQRTGGTPSTWIPYLPQASADFRITNGTDRFVITAAGNVGIGTTAPIALLHVNSPINSNGLVLQQNSAAAGFQQILFSVAGSIDGNAGNGAYIRSTTNRVANAFSTLEFATSPDASVAPAERMRITGTGAVGIGTNNPTNLLHISSAVSANIQMQVTGAGQFSEIIIRTAPTVLQIGVEGTAGTRFPGSIADSPYIGFTQAATLQFFTNNASRLRINQAGLHTMPAYAGSGTTTATFDVNGTLGRTTAFSFDVSDNLILADGKSIFTGLITGTDFGGSALQKLAFWGKTPIVQPTTAIAAAARVAVGGGVIQVNDTYGGYSIGKIAQALINAGILA